MTRSEINVHSTTWEEARAVYDLHWARGNKHVLLVSYAFPPVGGAGVQRVAKFSKYLGRFGWLPTVLTVANPSVPVMDHSLNRDLPAGMQIVRARSWEPGYATKQQAAGGAAKGAHPGGFKQRLTNLAGRMASTVLQPDSQILWYPNAVKAGKRLLATREFHAVFASAPPFSSFLVGAALARYAGLPLVVDYRDEWTLSNKYWENKKLGPISRAVQANMERMVLRRASAIVATTRASAEALHNHCERAGSKAQPTWIYNGFDTEDFAGCGEPQRDAARFRLVYTGTLWNLTSVEPLVKAVRQLSSAQPDLVKRLDLVFAGRRIGAQVEHVESLRGLGCRLETHDYLDHSVALKLLQGADAGCLLLSEVPGAERVVPAKLFEYLASARPILGLMPRGEAWDLLRDQPQASCLLPSNTEAIVKWLSAALADKSSITSRSASGASIERFSREFQANQLADVLHGCCKNGVRA